MRAVAAWRRCVEALNLSQRLKADPEWTTFAFDCGHNIPRLKPEALVEILLAQT